MNNVWVFQLQNSDETWMRMSKEEKEMFNFNISSFDVGHAYMCNIFGI